MLELEAVLPAQLGGWQIPEQHWLFFLHCLPARLHWSADATPAPNVPPSAASAEAAAALINSRRDREEAIVRVSESKRRPSTRCSYAVRGRISRCGSTNANWQELQVK